MTLADWKRMLIPGRRAVCTYRWYWGKDKPAPPNGREEIEFVQILTTQAIYKSADKERVWMHYPKAAELKATETGFELYFPNDAKLGLDRAGQLMSRYEWEPLAIDHINGNIHDNRRENLRVVSLKENRQ